MLPKVYIVILNYNNFSDTIECLESLLKLQYDNYQILVCDNNSTDNSMDYIKNWAAGKIEANIYFDLRKLDDPISAKPVDYALIDYQSGSFTKISGTEDEKIIFIQSHENKGFSAGNNIGIRYSLKKNDFEYIWILNNDTVVESNALYELVHMFNTRKKIGVVGSVSCYYSDVNKIQYIGGAFSHFSFKAKAIGEGTCINDINKVDLSQLNILAGNSFIMAKNFIKDIDCFLNEEYFLYYEEADLAERAKKLNWFIEPCLKSIVYHKGGGSTNKIQSSFLAYHSARSLFIFVKKYYFLHMPIPFFIMFLRVIYRFINGKYTQCYALLCGMFSGINKKSMD
jgi:hypothetical protein